METLFVQNVILSIALGFLIGLQRAMHIIYENKERDFGGTRTFAIISLLGFLSGWINKFYPYTFLIVVIVVALILIAGYIINSITSAHKGTTSEFSALIVFLVGSMLNFSSQIMVVFVTIVIMFLLNLKEKIRDYEKNISKQDFGATVLFLVMTFVILPIVPNYPIDPFGLINLFKIWLMVVLVAGISFFGYVAIRLLKTKKGIAVSGIFGGLISSTAVAMSLARKANENSILSKNLAIGISLASSIMLIRAFIVLFAFNPTLAKTLMLPMIIGLITGYGYILYIYLNTKYENIPQEITFKNPFEFKEALFMGFVFGFVLVLIELTNKYSGAYGVYAVSFVSGITDVDAILLSLSSLSNNDLDLSIARNSAIFAIVSNTIAKSVLVLIFGKKELFKHVFIYYLISIGSFLLAALYI